MDPQTLEARRTLSIPPASEPDALLTLPGVQVLVNLGKSTIYAKAQAGTFPQPVMRGNRCTRWRNGDVRGWLRAVAQPQKEAA